MGFTIFDTVFATKQNKVKERKPIKCTIALFQNEIKL